MSTRALASAHHAGPTASSIAASKAARTPPRSSAASPRAVEPPGERPHAAPQRVVAARAQQRSGAGKRLHHELGADRGGNAAADSRVDLGLRDEREVGGRTAHQRHRGIDQRLRQHDERTEAREERCDHFVERLALRLVSGLDDRALAYLDRE